ncbi:hypothetical protein [Pseudomonas sp.]|uniref:hypothetical protein n=1 Tax=Pseudomonas sp. TaxID=306 RepID=UPI00258FF87C|nr:hypothetical protein [Pseudomonas sp.]
MSKRKSHNMAKRMQTASASILRQHGVCVVNIDPANRQGLMSYKSLKNVRHGRVMANAICDYAHTWVIYIGAFCVDQYGHRYLKSTEIAPVGRHKSDDLADVLEQHYRELVKGCNPMQTVGSGWIANPCDVSLTEAQAFAVFEAAGGWSSENVAPVNGEQTALTSAKPTKVATPCSF